MSAAGQSPDPADAGTALLGCPLERWSHALAAAKVRESTVENHHSVESVPDMMHNVQVTEQVNGVDAFKNAVNDTALNIVLWQFSDTAQGLPAVVPGYQSALKAHM